MNIGAIQTGGWDVGALQYVPMGGTAYEESVTLSRSISFIAGSTAAFNAVVALSKNIDCASGGNGSYKDIMSLSKLLAFECSATGILNAVLSIDKLLSVVELAQAKTEATAILAVIKQISATNGSIYDVELSLSKTLDNYVMCTGYYQDEISLETIRTIVSAASSAAGANVTLDRNLSLDLIAQALSLASLDLGYSVSIEASATDSTIVIKTPAERTIKILFENRTIKIPYENRIIKIR